MTKPNLGELLRAKVDEIEEVESRRENGLISSEFALAEIQKLRREYTAIIIDSIMD